MLTPTALTEVDRAKNYSKLTKTLLAAMFDRETLQKSSLETGHYLWEGGRGIFSFLNF